MALLDLQGMENSSVELGHTSSTSGASCHGSELSVTLCEPQSGLSVLLCKHD